MRLPSGYGQVIKLGGKRRRPYAVRVDCGVEEVEPGKFRRKVKYLEYFAKRSDALDYLAKYNAGIVVEKTPAVPHIPTFAEVYEGFMAYYEAKNKDAPRGTVSGYRMAYKYSEPLHAMKFSAIRAADMQAIISTHSNQSLSTSKAIVKLFHGMYKYAGMNDICDKDYSRFIFAEGKETSHDAHTPFTDDEIAMMWDGGDGPILILLYTGMRILELLQMKVENVDLDAHIMRGGVKTEAGKNRIIPIHNAILPYIEQMMTGTYLIGDGDYSVKYPSFVKLIWEKTMRKYGLKHTPHDTRHTTTTLMERYDIPLLHRKLILGHTIKDITEGVYTHVKPEELVRDINRLPVFHS